MISPVTGSIISSCNSSVVSATAISFRIRPDLHTPIFRQSPFGAIAIIVAIVNSQPFAFVVGLVFWGMCLFAFVPVMMRAKKYEQEQREKAEAENATESSDS